MSYILFVDDEPESINLAAQYLARKGHKTAVVYDGREAIARIRETAPDILVTDILLPFADGYLVIKELQQHYPRDQVGVILLTTIAADGEPGRDWARSAIDTYILRHSNAEVLGWQIVLAVEQLLYQRGAA